MRSMTGCGAGTVQRDGWEVTAELKTVNHRFLDLSLRLPRTIAFLEPIVREEVGGRIRRGHVDVFLTVRNVAAAAMQVQLDLDLAMAYLTAGSQLGSATGVEQDLTVSRLMELEGVITLAEQEMDQGLVSSLCREALGMALTQVNRMRETEGDNLARDLSEHLEKAAALREKMLEAAPQVVEDYRRRLETRIASLLREEVEPQRLAQEVALMADRCAIDEELARLLSHIGQMRQYLTSREEIGKKMDFLIQEMNREANTIGSKASDARIAQWVVDLKSEIEKLREQIQNVE